MRVFLKRFPEFESAERKLIEAIVKEAKTELNSNHFGNLFDSAWQQLAAHKLSISPMGEGSRLDGDKNQTIYQLEFERICRSASLGARVI